MKATFISLAPGSLSLLATVDRSRIVIVFAIAALPSVFKSAARFFTTFNSFLSDFSQKELVKKALETQILKKIYTFEYFNIP